jgi:glycerophosphoryl diester phosphodiesterase
MTIDEFLDVDSARPRVIAHRGFSGVAPENSLAAIRKAIDLGADMVEIDVLLSRDGHVVVIHDETVDRTTDGRGKVASLDLEELRRLDAGSWFSKAFAGEKIPTLAEVLDLVRGRILLNVEIKTEAVTPEAEGGISDKVLRLIAEREMGEQVILSSFDPEALRQARRLDSAIRTASLYDKDLHRGMGPVEVMAAVGSNGFNLSARQLSDEVLRACHGQRRPVAVYTVDDKKKMERLIAAGVDAIFTNRPDRMLELLGKAEPDGGR